MELALVDDAAGNGAATFTERNAPSTFSTPEIVTATFGFRAPMAIEVAIALAVSWKPLVKSNASAVMTTI